MVYRSDDGGETWAELPSPYEGSFFGVLPLDDDALLLFGLRGHLFRSEDAGETWTRDRDRDRRRCSPTASRSTTARWSWSGLAGVVLVSGDGGRTLRAPAADGPPWHARPSSRTSGTALVLVGEFGVRTAVGERADLRPRAAEGSEER